MKDAPPSLPGWALVLGASSGFGAAASLEFARAGSDVVGVHFDRRATVAQARAVETSVRETGHEAWFHNVNAADEGRIAEVLDHVSSRWTERREKTRCFRVVLHSLAFGALVPLVAEGQDECASTKQLLMTTNVMGHSLVSWVQALVEREMLGDGGRVFAMTSSGSWSVWPGYGAVSAAKAALEAHVRQLAVELAPMGITVNAICAGVTDTPALRKIPTHPSMIQVALRKNPHGRLTRPEDVAAALVSLASPSTYWMTGNVINVDGGEAVVG